MVIIRRRQHVHVAIAVHIESVNTSGPIGPFGGVGGVVHDHAEGEILMAVVFIPGNFIVNQGR